jgi:lysophospholipase L1-like esterase
MKNWISTWGLAHSDIRNFSPNYKDRTMRLSIPNNLAGEALRLRFSNRDGKKLLHISRAAVHIEKIFPVSFKGNAELILQPGEEQYSDPVSVSVSFGIYLIISVTFKGSVSSGNNIFAIVQCSPKGDFVDAPQFQSVHRSWIACYHDMMQPVPALSSVEVFTEKVANAVVCFGDSITQQGKWTEPLANALYRQFPGQISLINKGIGGNRLLHGPIPLIGAMYGQPGKERFNRDVLEEAGIRTVIFAIGTNDIGMVRDTKHKQWVWADMIITTLTELVQTARQQGLRIFGTTILPRGGVPGYLPVQENERLKLNQWLRETSIFDALFDFDVAVRDPAHPEQMAFSFDSGDHLHPGMLGGQQMAHCILETLNKQEGNLL